MEHTLRTGITAETLLGPIRIDSDGCLTKDSVKDLIPILRRGATFQGCPDLLVTLDAETNTDRLAPAEGQDALTVVGSNNTVICCISAEDLLAAAHPDPTSNPEAPAARTAVGLSAGGLFS